METSSRQMSVVVTSSRQKTPPPPPPPAAIHTGPVDATSPVFIMPMSYHQLPRPSLGDLHTDVNASQARQPLKFGGGSSPRRLGQHGSRSTFTLSPTMQSKAGTMRRSPSKASKDSLSLTLSSSTSRRPPASTSTQRLKRSASLHADKTLTVDDLLLLSNSCTVETGMASTSMTTINRSRSVPSLPKVAITTRPMAKVAFGRTTSDANMRPSTSPSSMSTTARKDHSVSTSPESILKLGMATNVTAAGVQHVDEASVRLTPPLDATSEGVQFKILCSSFLPDCDYLDLIRSVRGSRNEILNARRREEEEARRAAEIARSEELAEEEAKRIALVLEAERRAKFEARQREENERRIAVAEKKARKARLEALARAKEEARIKEEQEQKAKHIRNYGPISTDSTDVGITVEKSAKKRGVRVSEVIPGSLADDAGINVHDVFVEINGRPVINSKPYRVMALLNKFSPPKTIKALITKPEHNIGLYPIKDQHKTMIIIKKPKPNPGKHRFSSFSQECFDDPTAVEYLDLRAQGLKSLPANIDEFVNLQGLELAENTMEELPETLGHLKNLRKLDCSRNGLKSLPESIGGLPQLTALYLFQEKLIQTLPNTIGGLASLTVLNLPFNSLRSLPASINNLHNLKTLWLAENKLTTLPSNLAGLKSLTKLILDGNPFELVPDGIRELPAVTTLSLGRCQLVELPRWIQELSKTLEILTLDRNLLTFLPVEIGHLSHLLELDISHNDLSTVPAEMGHLRRLRALALHNQKKVIQRLPEELQYCSSLTKIRLGLFNHICPSPACCLLSLVGLPGDTLGPSNEIDDVPSDEDEDSSSEDDGSFIA